LGQELEKMRLDIEKERQKIKDAEQAQKSKMNEKNYFEHKLTKYIPKVIEVNLIAKEFKRNVSMAVKLFLIP
jgi:kinesin family protein 13